MTLMGDTEMRSLVARGMGRKQIAKHFGLPVGTIYRRLRSLDLDAPTEGRMKRVNPLNLPKVSVQRDGRSISLPSITMHRNALSERRSA